ncbi:MAG: hypothetical protein KJO78_14955 [Alphaproteobacteria bacterium]|nr:hypothetical protein [Alphaproteobacteria bacterium]
MPDRRQVLLGAACAGLVPQLSVSQQNQGFPPVPTWRPTFRPDIDQIAERFRFYSNNTLDFVIFRNSTCCVVPQGLVEDDAITAAADVLTLIISFHPDMNPRRMDDGHILITYNHPAYNIIAPEFAWAHQDEIDARHLDGLTPGEVLVTPLGPNVFDEVGKLALLGRCYMFLDALGPEVAMIGRGGD